MLSSCAGCEERGPSPCRVCLKQLRPAAPPCPEGIDTCVAAFLFADVGRTLVSALKYRNQRQSLAWMATALARRVSIAGEAGAELEIDVVTWIPTTGTRRRQRGFDQAELLARRTARRLRIPVRGLLLPSSTGSNASQTGLSAAERHARGAFRARRSIVGGSVLVIDDVLTTGASFEAAALALRAAGAFEVHAAALAYTPAPAERDPLNAP